MGTLAPIEVMRAEAQIAAGQQQLVLAQTQVLQQETILKTALSRTGVASPSIADAHIIPTDQIRIPDVEPVTPIQDMMAMAISSRPELAQSRIQIDQPGADASGATATRCCPPSMRWSASRNSALVGEPSSLVAPAGTVHSNNPFFIGGYGTVLSQIFSRNFPNYAVGFNLTIPLRNRSAQAQIISDELTCASSNSACSGWKTRCAWMCRTA